MKRTKRKKSTAGNLVIALNADLMGGDPSIAAGTYVQLDLPAILASSKVEA